ncbi:hypothetical protein CgunFtcFv8_012488 [Champsocephalus gunnari]|uniref:Uncharacterized protein n=1 Tax=Champsocephalus gunnari TaxID=52237 RepID=A0AAN8HTT4_CHAGU|nr:hypothetical protein CgunFtcFv8_012488 [Champsocephalus gunnari]
MYRVGAVKRKLDHSRPAESSGLEAAARSHEESAFKRSSAESQGVCIQEEQRGVTRSLHSRGAAQEHLERVYPEL